MSGRNWKLWLPLAIFMVALLFIDWQMRHPADREVVSEMIGKPLPQFDLRPAADGTSGLATADFRDGKPRLLNIWASWCVPCAAEAPQLAALKAQGVEILGVAIRDKKQDVADFLAQYGNPYARLGADDISAVQFGIGSSGVPETFVIDGKGVIRYQHIGEIRADDVPMLIGKLRDAAQ